jgi:hypothetical protein
MFGKKKEKPPETPKKKDEDWMTKKWRPMMAMMYMLSSRLFHISHHVHSGTVLGNTSCQ